jgi:hypothetical protein
VTADSMRRHHGVVVGRFPVCSKEQYASERSRNQEAEPDPEPPRNVFGETDQDVTPNNTKTPLPPSSLHLMYKTCLVMLIPRT